MKKTFVMKQQLEGIAQDYPTPFYLYDEQGIRENARPCHRRSGGQYHCLFGAFGGKNRPFEQSRRG